MPKATGSKKKIKSTVLRTCMFPAITAITEYIYKPIWPKNFKNKRIEKKQKNK